MKKNIILHGKKIEYTIKKSKRARNMRLTVNCDAQLVVTVPRFVGWGTVERFILQKSSWIIKTIENFKQNRIFLNTSNYNDVKAKARELIITKVEHYNQFYNFEYNRICVKNHKRIWGSCSSKKRLNFNYRLLFLSEELADYIIVHELCHLQEMNHSQQFWQLLSRTFPDYKEKKRELKRVSF